MKKSMLDKILEVMEINNSFENEMAEIFLEKCEEYTDYKELTDAIDNGDFIPSNGCIGALMYYRQTHEIFKKYFDEIFEVINDEFAVRYGSEYHWGLTCNMLVWTAFEFLTYRWHEAILTLME